MNAPLASIFMAVVGPGPPARSATWLEQFPHAAVFSDGRCWDAACAARGPASPCRLEAAFGCALRAAEDAGAAPRWFAFTDAETWWHAVCKSNTQIDFNVSVFECFDARLSTVLRELDESNRSVQKSAESTSI